ncbi:hypothetical protein BBP40_008869 [Aspergillus hancockii]|nr:hypothetical protein BBP40_008869 [Aspergillus hancockii]
MSSPYSLNIPRPSRPSDDNPPSYSSVVRSSNPSPGLLAPGPPVDNALGQSRYHGSTSSLALSHSSIPIREGKRRLLLIYIHGFIGTEESFHDFPKHVHDLLTISLSQTHVVYTKIYPRYKTRGPVHIARDNFSRWLSPHESPDLDVILLGHSLGGIVSAEVALMPSQSSPGRAVDVGLNHRVLGLVNFDVPFFGLHPRVVTTGIGRLFRTKPDETSAANQSATPLEDNIDPLGTTFNPAFTNDVKLTEWAGWGGARHFISKYSKHLSRSVLQYAFSYYDHAGCMNNYPELFKRHKRLLKLEAIDEFSQDDPLRGPARVRFVNYYTKSTGITTPSGKDTAIATSGEVKKGAHESNNPPTTVKAASMLQVNPAPGHIRTKSAPDCRVEGQGKPAQDGDIERPKSSGAESPLSHSGSTTANVGKGTRASLLGEDSNKGRDDVSQYQTARRQFCYFPTYACQGQEHLWVPVHMEGIDEITAHQSMFLPRCTYYDKLVGDTVACIESWIEDDLTKRAILNGEFEK